jgi:hypothetical protein
VPYTHTAVVILDTNTSA